MSDDNESTIETKGLDALIKAMSVPAPVVRVGILGAKTNRESEETKGGKLKIETNAEIGALYEFNDGSRPGGSFLRVPIAEHLEKKMERSGAFEKDALAEVIASRSLTPYMKKVAVLAEECVAEAFETSGDGKWKQSDMTHKKNHQTLVETQQLRNSITSEVKESSG